MKCIVNSIKHCIQLEEISMVGRGEHYRLVLSGDLSVTHRVAQICAQTLLTRTIDGFAPLPLPTISNLTDFIILLRKYSQ